MDDLICFGIIALLPATVATIIYWRYFSSYPGRSDPDPIILDARRGLGAIIEAGSIVEQRKAGRERGGDVTLITDHEPGHSGSFEADLNFRTLQFEERRGKIKLDNRYNQD